MPIGKPRSWRRWRADALGTALGALALTAAACGGSDGGSDAASRQTLRVLAASSLTESFTELAAAFERSNRDISVALEFGASSLLVEQVSQGAPFDVLVTADATTMGRAASGGDVGATTRVARNDLVGVVERGNPAKVTRLEDLARPGLAVVLCAPAVPCGRLAAALLESRRVEVRPRSLEPDVKAVVARVAQGEADAGVAYRTDALAAAGQVEAVDLGPQVEGAVYEAAVARRTSHGTAARRWIRFLRSSAAQARLRARGFLAP